MGKYFKFLLLFFIFLSIECKEKKDQIIENKKNITTNDKLKDGIDRSTSFIEDLEFNKYKYEGQYIEQIQMSSLEDKIFRDTFFQYLTNRNFDQNQYEQIFFIKLLLTRIQQLDDLRSFYFLTLIFNDKNLSYYLEDYELELFQLFLYKPHFFIKGEYKYKDAHLNDYINKNLPSALLTSKAYFDQNIVEVQFQDNSLLISDEKLNSFTIDNLAKQIKQKGKKIEAFFSPSYDTAWQNKIVVYYNVYEYLDEILAHHLDENEFLLYKIKYKPFFKNYITKKEKNQYTIQDPDGFTNLRKEKSTHSEVLQEIRSGEQIEVLDHSGDWWLIQSIQGNKGYVHSSKIKSK